MGRGAAPAGGKLSGFLLGVASAAIVHFLWRRFHLFRRLKRALFGGAAPCPSTGAFLDLIGNTPLVKLHRLSEELRVDVFGKAEFVNPGGSVKDRVARSIVEDAEREGLLVEPGDYIVEGTSGSTGISLACVANCRGYRTHIYMPNDQAAEKSQVLRVLGAHVVQLPSCRITDPKHYCNAARTAALNLVTERQSRAVFVDQFENPANFKAHYEGTG